ncbi:Thioredoxin 1 redox factor [Candidatus Nasuia deltocephalinicola]|nr:Thioredoxin 1 redox factor [Candidatus Nasuia deltocephalinicola]
MKKNINDIFLQKIIKNSNVPILVSFWANWCVPCKILSEIIKNIKYFYKEKIKIVKLNIEYNYYSVEKFLIKNIPTIIIIKNKIIIKKKSGILTKNYIKNIINKILNEK